MPSTTPIRTGIIGFGLSGRVFHAPFIRTNDAFSLEIIATSDAERQATAAAEHPLAKIVGTPAELLAEGGDLDLVILASPAHTHLEQGLAALAAGAAVVIDKPFVPSVSDAKQLIAASEAAGKPLVVFQNRRWDGDFLTVKKLVESGTFGTVHRFESTFERMAAPNKPRWQDTTTIAEGAGIAFDLGSHLVDQALQLFGPANVVQAEISVLREGSVSDDDAFISLLHTSGVRSHLTMSRAAGQAGPRFRVLGTDNAYSVYGLDGQEAALDHHVWPGAKDYGVTPKAEWGMLGISNSAVGLAAVPTEPGNYPAFYAGVAAAIRDGKPVPVDPRESLEVVRIIQRAHELSTS